MKHEFSHLAETVTELTKNRPVYFLQNPGNYGDAIIRHGTLKFFKDINLKYSAVAPLTWKDSKFTTLPFKTVLKMYLEGAAVIYSGSGAWCSYWNHAYEVIKKLNFLNKLCKRINIIILPTTFENKYDLPGVTVFTRDKFQSLKNMPNATFCHDMGFYIDKMNVVPGDEPGYFFRTDKESPHKIKIPKNNFDISSRGTHISDVKLFYQTLAKYSVIHTDRLHVAIAGCHLGREVHIYPNAYFKNKAVYESSIKDYFENIHFHEKFDFKAPVEPPLFA